jgi:hypothetical protein
MSGRILRRVLSLTEFKVVRLCHDAGALRACVLAVAANVVYSHHHGVRDLAGSWRPALPTHVSDDDRPVVDAELRAVVLTDPHALRESERSSQPVDGLAHVRIDEYGNNGR